MAINVTQSPSTNTAAHSPVIWKFQFSAMGVLPVVKRMTYYLADSSSVRISEIYVWTPKDAADVLTVDVSDLVIPLVKTEINLPFLTPPVAIITATDATVVKGVKIMYTENDFNTATCINTPLTEQSTAVVNVWNNKLNLENNSFFSWTGGKTGALMNTLPSRMYWGYDTSPYIWFAGIGVVKITYYNTVGTNLGSATHNVSGANTAKYISLVHTDYGTTSLPYSALLEVNNGMGWKNYNISFDVCTCKGSYTGVMFLDPLGGRSFAPAKCESEGQVNRKGDTIVRYEPTLLKNGTSFVNSNAVDQIKLNIPLGDTIEDHDFARALVASPGHHLHKISTTGVKTLHKAILNSATISTVTKGKSTILDLTFELVDDKSGQRQDV
ncbi:MAG: hypothetical protein HOP11_09005 [Saprospiraceae bacterium]|nr:hypothetical protein [Saprospiraceae bacterium]